MWQRFTGEARRAIGAAQHEAEREGRGEVLPAHLLLAALDCSAAPVENADETETSENETAAARVVMSLDVEPQLLRLAIQSRLRGVPVKSGRGETKLSLRSKRALEFAADEARRLDAGGIGTEHLLLAVARPQSSFMPFDAAVLWIGLQLRFVSRETWLRARRANLSAAQVFFGREERDVFVADVLREFGLDLQSLRFAAGAGKEESAASRWTNEVTRIAAHAQHEARTTGAGRIGTEHLWLGILAAPNAAREKLEISQIDLGNLAKHLRAALRSDDETAGTKARYTPEARGVWRQAEKIARAKRFRFIGADHLLLALAGLGEQNALERAQKTMAGETTSRADAAIARALEEQLLAPDYLREILEGRVRSNSTVLGTDVVSRVTQIVAEELGIPVEEVTRETVLMQQARSHLDVFEMFRRASREFSISFSAEEAKACRTASDLANAVVAKVLGNKTVPVPRRTELQSRPASQRDRLIAIASPLVVWLVFLFIYRMYPSDFRSPIKGATDAFRDLTTVGAFPLALLFLVRSKKWRTIFAYFLIGWIVLLGVLRLYYP